MLCAYRAGVNRSSRVTSTAPLPIEYSTSRPIRGRTSTRSRSARTSVGGGGGTTRQRRGGSSSCWPASVSPRAALRRVVWIAYPSAPSRSRRSHHSAMRWPERFVPRCSRRPGRGSRAPRPHGREDATRRALAIRLPIPGPAMLATLSCRDCSRRAATHLLGGPRRLTSRASSGRGCRARRTARCTAWLCRIEGHDVAEAHLPPSLGTAPHGPSSRRRCRAGGLLRRAAVSRIPWT